MKNINYQAYILSLIILEFFTCVIGFMVWKKINKSYWKFFPFFLAFLVIGESIAVYSSYVLGNQDLNRIIYRYFVVPGEFLFFFWLFRQYFKPLKKSKLTWVFAIIYIISWIADVIYFSEQVYFFSSFSYSIGNILLLILIAHFLYGFIKSDQVVKYKSDTMFWVSVGMLIFFLCTFPFHAFRRPLYDYDRDLFGNLWLFSMIFNYMMYMCFILAFVWGKPK